MTKNLYVHECKGVASPKPLKFRAMVSFSAERVDDDLVEEVWPIPASLRAVGFFAGSFQSIESDPFSPMARDSAEAMIVVLNAQIRGGRSRLFKDPPNFRMTDAQAQAESSALSEISSALAARAEAAQSPLFSLDKAYGSRR